MLYYGFILPDGTELTMSEKIRTHEDLAINYIEENRLMKDYRRSSCEDPVDYMVVELGAIKVGNFASSTSITVSVPFFSEYIKSMTEMYSKKGYRVDRFFRRKQE